MGSYEMNHKSRTPELSEKCPDRHTWPKALKDTELNNLSPLISALVDNLTS